MLNTHADKTQENKSQSFANDTSYKNNGGPTFRFIDNRPEAVAQRKLISIIHNTNPIQFTKKRPGARHPIEEVKAYPSLAGEKTGVIPVIPECKEAANKILDELEAIAEKEGIRAVGKEKTIGPPTGKEAATASTTEYQGFIIGIAKIDGKLVGSCSGTVPDTVLEVIKKHVSSVVQKNVLATEANSVVGKSEVPTETEEMEKSEGRLKVSYPGGVPGAPAGFCAGFKLSHECKGQIQGMVEVLFAPKEIGPNVQVMDAHGEVVTYEHRDIVPSCATCQAAIPVIENEKSQHKEAENRRLKAAQEQREQEAKAPISTLKSEISTIKSQLEGFRTAELQRVSTAALACLTQAEKIISDLSDDEAHLSGRKNLGENLGKVSTNIMEIINAHKPKDKVQSVVAKLDKLLTDMNPVEKREKEEDDDDVTETDPTSEEWDKLLSGYPEALTTVKSKRLYTSDKVDKDSIKSASPDGKMIRIIEEDGTQWLLNIESGKIT